MPYLAHFGLREHPFSLTPNTARYFPTSSKAQVLESLRYGVARSAGIMKVVGDVGTGKTLLCRLLLRRLSEDRAEVGTDQGGIAYLNAPQADGDALIALICHEFGLPDGDRAAMLRGLNEYLLARHADGLETVLVIDEAQALGPGGLETVRLLSNLETERAKLLQIVMFGQHELDVLLSRPELRQINQRIAFSFDSGPFSRAEVGAYITHCLRVSRLEGVGYDIFEPKALEVVSRVSAGVPRVINILCDKALLIAYGDGARMVTRDHVRAAVADSAALLAPLSGVAPAPVTAAADGRRGWGWAAAIAGLVLGVGAGGAAALWALDGGAGLRQMVLPTRAEVSVAPIAPVVPVAPQAPKSVAAPVAPPVAPSVAEPVAEPVIEPVAEAAPEPVPDPVVEPAPESVAATVPASEPMPDAEPEAASSAEVGPTEVAPTEVLPDREPQPPAKVAPAPAPKAVAAPAAPRPVSKPSTVVDAAPPLPVPPPRAAATSAAAPSEVDPSEAEPAFLVRRDTVRMVGPGVDAAQPPADASVSGEALEVAPVSAARPETRDDAGTARTPNAVRPVVAAPGEDGRWDWR